jgi:PKD repeat protein
VVQLVQIGLALGGAAPLQVQFGDASSPAGAAEQWLWDFGDGAGSNN